MNGHVQNKIHTHPVNDALMVQVPQTEQNVNEERPDLGLLVQVQARAVPRRNQIHQRAGIGVLNVKDMCVHDGNREK